MNTIRFIAVLVLAIIAAYVAAFANGREIVPLAAWIAPTLLLRVTRSQSPVLGFVVALAVMTPAWIFAWSDALRLHGLMIYLSAVVAAGFTLMPYLADRLVARRLPKLAAMFVFPTALVAMEWCFTLISPFGSWGASAYTQTDFSWLLQSASITGMWSISFLIGWFASAVNTAWELRPSWKQALIPLAAFAAVFLIAIGAGAWRLSQQNPEGNAPLAIALPQVANNQNFSLDYSAPIRAYMFAQTDALAHHGAQMVVWPEDTLALVAADEDGFISQARELAQRDRTAIALSYTMRFTPQSLRYENKSVLISASGAIAWRTSKTFPVPGAEERNMRPGNGEIAAATLPLGLVQGATGFDLDHRAAMRQVGQSTALLLAPSDDWPAVVDLHARMVRMRAVEYGVPILRPTLNGASVAYDAFGAAVPLPTQTLRLAMPVGAAPTLYPRIGDVFAWLCVAALALLGVFSALPKPRMAITPPPVGQVAAE
jgi:apolipoprotein N-acyltransferase